MNSLHFQKSNAKISVYFQLERFLLHQATIEQSDGNHVPYNIASSLCFTHREQIRHANITDEHILIPVRKIFNKKKKKKDHISIYLNRYAIQMVSMLLFNAIKVNDIVGV